MKSLLLVFTVAFSALLSSCGGKSEEKIQEVKKGIDSLEVTQIVALGRIEPESKIASLAINATGLLADIAVKEGQKVQKGANLLRLESSKEQADVALKRTKIATQREDIIVKSKELAKAMVDQQENEKKLRRSSALLAKGAETQEANDDAKAKVASAAADIERIKATIESASIKMNELSADVQVSVAELDKRKLNAPVSGTVLTIKPTLGSLVQSGTTVIEFAPDGTMTALAEVDELFVDKVALNQSVNIRAQGGDKVLVTGKIVFIAPSLKKKSLFSDDSNNLEDRRVREVRIALDASSTLLMNSRVECVILLKTK